VSANTAMAEKYRNNFLKEIEEQVEMGDWVKMCMQCGVCSGSCPTNFQSAWEHPPQEVLTTTSMWNCTSCYNCIVRCPRKLPITHIMHGIAEYAHRIGMAPKMQATRFFSGLFWKNCTNKGRVNELKLSMGLYFKDGFMQGIKNGMAMQSVALGLVKAKRLNVMELFGGHKCKDQKGIQAMLKKAYEIERSRKAAKMAG
jgi:quinone-modifying oxidoreductase subunit QmoC